MNISTRGTVLTENCLETPGEQSYEKDPHRTGQEEMRREQVGTCVQRR